MSSRDKTTRIYVGNLPPDVRAKELEAMFDRFGKIIKVELKNGAGRGPPFAFIEYEDYRDADDAVRTKNGANFDGYSLRVEVPHANREGGSRGRGMGRGPPRYDDRRDGGYYNGNGYRGSYDRRYERSYDRGYDRVYDRDRGSDYRDGGYGGRERRSAPIRRQYKVVVTGLPDTATVDDLKKHMKDAGDVISSSLKDGTGYIEYDNNEDMRYAVKKLDGTEMEVDGEKSIITVKEDRSSSRSRSRSPARRDRSLSPSPRKSRSPSRSRSP